MPRTRGKNVYEMTRVHSYYFWGKQEHVKALRVLVLLEEIAASGKIPAKDRRWLSKYLTKHYAATEEDGW